jgi:hypothetical protein
MRLDSGPREKLNRDKIGEFILAFDESKRLLGVVARDKVGFTSKFPHGSNERVTSAYVAHLCLRQRP